MGRPTGSPNKRRDTLEALLVKKFPDWNPIIHMAEIANDPEAETVVKLNACKEVAAYLYPKLRSIEMTGNDGEPLKIGLIQFAADGTTS